MSLIDTIREWLDAPRFCPDDGQPIEVTRRDGYRERTGERYDRWFWHCPDVSVHQDGGSIKWQQWAVHRVHVHGEGRPRWHQAAALRSQPTPTETPSLLTEEGA